VTGATDLSLRLLIERVRDYAIFTLDPTGIITSWNPGAVKIKGYVAEEAIGRHFSMLYREEDAAKGIPDHNLRIAEAEGVFIDHEGIRKKKNGDLFTVEVEIVALVDHGQLVGFAKVIRDVTDKIRMRDELRRVNADLDQFTAIAAHDLQEPLRMVTSYLALLARHGADRFDDRLRGYLDHASSGATRMTRLITYLRNLSRVGQVALNIESVDLNQALADALQNLSVRIDEAEATIASEPMPRAIADSGLITQVFQNLLSNAVKFVKPGETPRVHVSAHVDDAERRIVIMIRDHGIGMRPEDRERIFRPFVRAAGGGYPGAGLGLSICQRIIERHRCHIWVESQAGVGSTFFFTLPAA
jgi:PAS domain S-box-containing protein